MPLGKLRGRDNTIRSVTPYNYAKIACRFETQLPLKVSDRKLLPSLFQPPSHRRP